ncbi:MULTISPECIES: hypothetical protein [Vibrio]|uniref:hypothetical protein n=1 Tax=Vibrio TaxID=662 RepID=UPI001E4A8DA9|nr:MULTISPECIES: hypothetical protein [Vibrio]MCC2524940.1 hypothetical protein [Vibrio coralliilyticus]USD35486.1 hypothetical protein J8Z27_22975 [Vibrio sp. SCSIO 43186]USD72610.1 hypothetical protein J4N41_22980 [Vibrio sp. SCSIO 43139]USD99001.1 hypothetical protein CTT30_23290 [Vibrio coralliilyticus]
MNENEIPPSDLERILEVLLRQDIPALYYLFERLAILLSAVYFASMLFTVLRVRALTGNHSAAAMQMSDASPLSLLAKFFASVFLGSFGFGQAVISNTLFLGNYEPYSVEVLQSISCSINDMSGCAHYELGLFADGSWSKATINETLYEFSIGVIAIFGTICYFIGWTNFAKLGGQQIKRTFWQCMGQIGIGAALMRPVETWQAFTGGFFSV